MMMGKYALDPSILLDWKGVYVRMVISVRGVRTPSPREVVSGDA
jgi:hypothetical protein